jgi:hypothetical protein
LITLSFPAEIAGGDIKNIALDAAFLASDNKKRFSIRVLFQPREARAL